MELLELVVQVLLESSVSFIPFFIFGFWSLLATNIQNYKNISNLCLHFAKQGGEDGKTRKENHAAKVTKIPKTKRRKHGMHEHLRQNSTYLQLKYGF